jgi:lipopolysaccharide assembly outer membrane protein LptD (OstA)
MRRSRRQRAALLALLIFLWAPGARGQGKPLILEYARRAESHWRDDQLVTVLVGDVHFVHGHLHLYSDRATWNQEQDVVNFEGRVVLQDTSQSITAQRITYLRGESKAMADGQVTLVDSLNNMKLHAGHVEYERKTGIARAELQPRLIIHREEEGQPITIGGRHMEVLSRQKEALVHDQVIITRGQLEARCGQARYLDLENRIILDEEPVAQEDKSILQGRRMVIYLEGNQITRIDVQDQASGKYVSAADSSDERPGQHHITARELSFFLADEQVQRISAEGNASSVYLPSAEAPSHRGENQTSGDRLEIFLQDEIVERAVVEGGALGQYFNPQDGAADTARYGAQEIEYSLLRDEISLVGEAFIDYGQISLKAHQIVYNTQTEILTAQERSVPEEEASAERGRPRLKEGDRELVGSHMIYHLRTQRGKVVEGQTEFEKGHYQGAAIRKVEESVLRAEHGTFTTCDRIEEPHYHFYSRRMKIVLKDKVIAKPVVLYFGKIPVMILPFYVFPIKRGRHSGFLIPRYGTTDADGRYLKGLGYYLAPSQYWDATAALDVYERTGWLLDLEGRYAVRYLLNGSLAGSYKWDERYSGAVLQKRRRWDLRLSHSQDITPTVQLQANGTFIGQNDRSYYQDISDDPYQRMDRNIHSYFSLDKTWSSARASMDLDQRWDLDADVTTRYLPTVSFQRFDRPIYQPKQEGREQPAKEAPWYSSVYYRYSARFINSLKDWSEEEDGQAVERHEEHQAIDQTLGLRVPLTLFGHLALTPSATYRETWFDRDKSGERYVRRGDYDASVGANTTLYGLVQPHIGPLLGIRHVMKPSLSFSWRPDFKDRNDYYSVPFIHSVGGPQKTLGMSLSNQFQIKLGKGDQERKYTVADLNFNTGYNFEAETRKLSNLRSSLRVQPTRLMNVTLNANHDFYDPNGADLRLFSPRLISFSVDTRLNLAGRGGGRQDDGAAGGKAWRLSLSHRYSESRSSSGVRKTSWLNGGVSLFLTDHWRVDYSGRYDVKKREFVSQRIEFYRDLHCWEARFVWEPTGYRQGYYVRINIKAIPEIKLERLKGIRG